ncbi:MAG: hypothetical protein NTW96_09640 [Planctomycetia bacterium]|nr:hypothetical protein [Planctomycetia bacterium]
MQRAARAAFWLGALSIIASGAAGSDCHDLAVARQGDLRLTVYMCAHSVDALLADDPDAARCTALLRANGITKVCIEMCRGSFIVERAKLERVRDCLRKNGFAVAGGIAPVPGENFGVRQQAPLAWLNWQNPKTAKDLIPVVRMAAAVFDELVVDDFFCTGDVSDESAKARGPRDWPDYRRDLLARRAGEIFIGPAKEVNPKITMVIKFPQWYDLFHRFGYDVVRQPELFDRVWVGTESRGAWTQRFGFMQPYSGFVNYRWMAGLARQKIGAAWFDHCDCEPLDFLEQAYQAVLAGAREITVFNYGDLVQGHGGQALVCRDFTKLADLAKAVREHPVEGVWAYKPPHGEPSGDLYLMDFVGMLGVPLVPTAALPADAQCVFLPTQAAADKDILARVQGLVGRGATVVMTAGFVRDAVGGAEIARLAGVASPPDKTPRRASQVLDGGKLVAVPYGLDLATLLEPTDAEVLLAARVDGRDVPFLTRHRCDAATLYVLNTHTFSQADFDAVDEVLLAPRRLGLLELPTSWADTLRAAFTAPLGMRLEAPTRVTLQPLGRSGYVFYNYNLGPVTITFSTDDESLGRAADGFTGEPVKIVDKTLRVEIPARTVRWIAAGGR